jgi:hypothetical protein
MDTTQTISRRDAIRVAAIAGVDPRAVIRRHRGSRQSPAIVEAIDRAERVLGLRRDGGSTPAPAAANG